MLRRLVPLSVFVLVVGVWTVWAGPAQQVPVQQSAFDVPPHPRWYIGLEGMWEGRDVFVGTDTGEFDARHLDAILGFQPFGWMILQVGAGLTEITREDLDVDSDPGSEWLARIRANVAEYVFTAKPGVGRHQIARLGASVSYRDAEADFDDAIEDRYFEWQEWLIEPYLQYTVNRLGEGNHDPLDLAAMAVRIGPAFCWIDGRFHTDDIDDKRTLGLALGGDLLLACGLTVGVEARTYGNGDGSAGVSLAHRF